MSGVNRVILIGRLCRDPESRQANGKAVCNFSMATNETWRDTEGEKQERVEYHRIVIWGKLAEVAAKYLTKGSQVYIEGRLQTREWEKDGQKKYTTEIVASSLVMLGGKGEGGNDPEKPDSSESPNNPGGLSPDDLNQIPF